MHLRHMPCLITVLFSVTEWGATSPGIPGGRNWEERRGGKERKRGCAKQSKKQKRLTDRDRERDLKHRKVHWYVKMPAREIQIQRWLAIGCWMPMGADGHTHETIYRVNTRVERGSRIQKCRLAALHDLAYCYLSPEMLDSGYKMFFCLFRLHFEWMLNSFNVHLLATHNVGVANGDATTLFWLKKRPEILSCVELQIFILNCVFVCVYVGTEPTPFCVCQVDAAQHNSMWEELVSQQKKQQPHPVARPTPFLFSLTYLAELLYNTCSWNH